MSYRYTVSSIIQEHLLRQYRGKTILDDIGTVPFVVQFLELYDDSPDPGWRLRFMSHQPGYNTKGEAEHVRWCNLDEPLLEIWPQKTL